MSPVRTRGVCSMDIDIKDIGHDDLMDLLVHDDLFKLHMTLKILSQSVDKLENYMYTGIIQFPNKDTLKVLTQDIDIWCNSIKVINDSVRKNGANIIDDINSADDSDSRIGVD